MNRLAKIKSLLREEKIDAMLITSVPYISYLTGYTNFSSEEREAYLFITKKNHYICTDGRYSTAIIKEVPNFHLVEISAVTSIAKALSDLIQTHTIRVLGFEAENLTVAEWKKLKPIVKRMQAITLHSLRMIKESSEITTIEKACTIGDLAFKHIQTEIKAGMTEKQVAWRLEKYIREQNADLSFPPIVAFGANAAIPHHQTGITKLKQNDTILLDFGVKYNNYCSDMTRTIFIGKPSEKQKLIYETVLQAQKKSIELLYNKLVYYTESVTAVEIDTAARDYIIEKGYSSIPHSLGHGVGLEVHEPPTISPVSQIPLREGMVFSIEPGIYLPDEIGVRIEDIFVIEKTSIRQLTQSPQDIIVL